MDAQCHHPTAELRGFGLWRQNKVGVAPTLLIRVQIDRKDQKLTVMPPLARQLALP